MTPCSAVEVGQHWYWFLTIPWPEPILTYRPLDHLEQISVDFGSKCNNFHCRKSISLFSKCWPFCSSMLINIPNSLWPSDTIWRHRTGSGSTLAPIHLPEIRLTNDQWGPVTLIWGQFLRGPSPQLEWAASNGNRYPPYPQVMATAISQ